MKTIAHISDLHFGREVPEIAEALLEDLRGQAPDVVAVSGDLTQRARRAEFAAARAWLDRIAAPRIVVPGNHDIPLFDIATRFLAPLDRYRDYISRDLAPEYVDDALLIVGLNTARSFAWKEGRVSVSDLQRLREDFARLGAGRFKVLVAHHPFIARPGVARTRVVGRALPALAVVEAAGADLILTGHLHNGYLADVRTYHATIRRSILAAQAGTAISNRRRGEPNGYNLVRVSPGRVSVEVRAWTGAAFDGGRVAAFERAGLEWRLVAAPAAVGATADDGRGRAEGA